MTPETGPSLATGTGALPCPSGSLRTSLRSGYSPHTIRILFVYYLAMSLLYPYITCTSPDTTCACVAVQLYYILPVYPLLQVVCVGSIEELYQLSGVRVDDLHREK